MGEDKGSEKNEPLAGDVEVNLLVSSVGHTGGDLGAKVRPKSTKRNY
jgi:hypothetical protein